jgi:hypothetical protein
MEALNSCLGIGAGVSAALVLMYVAGQLLNLKD